MKQALNAIMNETVQKWASRITIGILAFLCTWGFTTILDMKESIIKLEHKIEDDKTQWTLIQQVYEGQVDHEVRLRFFEMIINDLRKDGNVNDDTEKLIEKIEEIKKNRSVDEFKDYHREQRQQQVK
jgi:flagellar biosynthesis component FlhA